jgi:hypothetical protein
MVSNVTSYLIFLPTLYLSLGMLFFMKLFSFMNLSFSLLIQIVVLFCLTSSLMNQFMFLLFLFHRILFHNLSFITLLYIILTLIFPPQGLVVINLLVLLKFILLSVGLLILYVLLVICRNIIANLQLTHSLPFPRTT